MRLKASLESELRNARRRLGRDAGPTAVHEARKAIKKLRAGLRLGRKAFGRKAVEQADRPLRAAGHSLGPLRDRQVLRETAGELRKPGEAVPRLPGPPPSGAAYAREARRRLGQAAERLKGLPGNEADSAALAEGLKRLYRQGRRAGRKALRDRSDAALHAWRRRTKDLLLALPLMGAVPASLAKKAGRLAELLGADHDLAAFAASPAARGKKGRPLRRRAAKRRRKLQEKAFRLGKRLYRRRPGGLRP